MRKSRTQGTLDQLLALIEKTPSLRGDRPKNLKVMFSIVGRATIKRLNLTFRGKNTATDVLSFEAASYFQENGILGELIICNDIARAQAKRLGHSYEQEIRVLMIHGLLHLLGFDHEKGPKEEARMARWERRLLMKLELSEKRRPLRKPGGKTLKKRLGLIDRTSSGIGKG